MPERKPIFYDQERQRWRRTRRVLEITGGLFTLLLVVFVVNVFRKPELPDILSAATHWNIHALPAKLRPKPVTRGRKRKVAALGKLPQNYDPLRAAFYAADDPTSLASLKLHYHDIDLLIPDALHASSPDGRLDIEQDPKLLTWMQTGTIELPIMSMVNNYDGKTWVTKETAEMLANPTARERLSKSLSDFASAQHQSGIVVDFEGVPQTSQPDFSRFIHELAIAMHAANLKLMVGVPAADWSYDYKYLATQADAIILMNYDLHYSTSDAGPIAPQDFFERNIESIVKIVPPEKIVMGIANYGYDWLAKSKKVPHPIAQPLTFQQGIITAVESESDVTFDPDSLNPHYSYEDEQNQIHNVWMLDGVTAYNELRAAERAGVRGTALWRLGMEDPSIWSIWDATHSTDAIRAKLEEVPPGYDLILEGAGDIWRITATPQSGRRTFDYDAVSDVFDDESYQSYPLSWRIEQMGAAPHKVALTFDDGPDPEWTPKILDILQQKHAPAAFFAIGESANQNPQLAKRAYQQGNEIGNHTFTHPDFETISKSQLQIELNLTELLIESNLGVKTLLFRPPFGIDHLPETASEIQMLPIPQAMGYIIVGAQVDPHDWGEPNGGAPPTTQLIVQRVLHDATLGRGNIILMHDGGGNRANTVAALPQIIDGLRAKGYDFVSISDLLGQSRAQVMPPLSHQEWLMVRADAFIFEVFRWFRAGIAFIFMAGILLVSGRALIIGLLALIEKLRPTPADHPEYKPNVTVLIPAFNEEAAIVNTVQSALTCDYPKLEILVVNDGSTDRTAELVNANFSREPRVRLISQPNRGKPAALNHGLAEATGEIIVSIDGDTIVDPEAIPRLVRHFADPKVGAVAGNVKVMNRNRWLTRWQALEYITSQNLEKRAFDLLNCIPVVPGAVGAWRTELLRANNGFSGDTVAEDTDLTLTIRRNGWKILYDEDAIGRTEVPETVEALIRQRFRWTFGTMQAVWKHRDAVGKPRYGTLGWIAIPNIVMFQIILPLVSPLIDLLFLLSIALWGLAQLRIAQLPQLWTLQDVERSLIFFALFMLIDLFTCVVAFALERHEDWTLLAPLILQRFYYRQMMYVVLFRALKEAVQGRPVGWRGVEPHMPAPVERVKRSRTSSDARDRAMLWLVKCDVASVIVLWAKVRAQILGGGMRDTISDFMREFTQASRLMVRQPRFFLITILVLSLGIGMSTALFSVMYGVLLRPLPVHQQDRLVIAWKGDRSDLTHVGELSYPEFQDWQRQSSAFEMLAAMPTTVYGYGLTLTGRGEPVELERTPVTAAFFSALGAQPALGRTFQELDDHPGAEPTVVLQYSLWKNQFHADPSVIGKTVSLNGDGYTVIGVMPPDFDFPAGAQLWTPLGLNAQWTNRDATFLQVVGRLKPGVSLRQSTTDINRVMANVSEQNPQYSEPGEFAVVTPLPDYVFGSNKSAILLLWGASLLLLVIACINITSLLLARAIVREKEIAVRLALGATRGRLLRQFVAEGSVLSFAGVLGGCAVARILIAVVHALAPPGIPRLSSVHLNVFSLVFACFVSIAVAATFGLAPTLLMMRQDVRDSLNECTSRAAGSRRSAFFRKSLLVSEAMVTMLLLVSAGMVVHNYYNLQRVQLGFVLENTLTAQIRVTNVDAAQRKAFFAELLHRLQSQSEVSAAGAILLRPFEGNIGWDVPYQARGQDIYAAKRNPISNFEVITPGYFQAVGTPLLAGRYFTFDDKDPKEKVIIVSESLARRVFGDVQRSISRQVRLGRADARDENSEWRTIVGVVADAQYRKLGITQGDIFVPFLQTDVPLRYVAVRTRVSPASFAPVLRQDVAAINKTLAVSKLRTMEQLIADAKVGPRFAMLLFSMFGVFAGFLASVGVYGLVSDSVAQRRREIGIRMALGAQRRSVVYLVSLSEMSSIILGAFLGLVLSVGLAHVSAYLLYGLQGIDFLSVAAAFVVLCLVSLTTSVVPTLRATQVPLANLLVD